MNTCPVPVHLTGLDGARATLTCGWPVAATVLAVCERGCLHQHPMCEFHAGGPQGCSSCAAEDEVVPVHILDTQVHLAEEPRWFDALLNHLAGRT